MFKNYGGIENIDAFNQALPDGKLKFTFTFSEKKKLFIIYTKFLMKI